MSSTKKKLFHYGQIVQTLGVSEMAGADQAFRVFIAASFTRHIGGDWGELDPEDAAMNDEAVELNAADQPPSRIMSVYLYTKPGGNTEKLWIVTEPQPSDNAKGYVLATTILFPHKD